MRKLMTSGWRAALLSPLALFANPAGAAPSAPDRFFQTFSPAGEPAMLHFRVVFRGPDGVHHMEVWRDHERRLKRTTDAAIETYAFSIGTGPDYRLSVLDLKRRINTVVERTNLYRIGQVTDWYDLGHGLRHPVGPYTLTAGVAPAHMPATPAACRWYDLASAGRTTRVCWDDAHRLPLLIASAPGDLLWRVTAVDPRPFSAKVFVINDRGFVRNNADRDIAVD